MQLKIVKPTARTGAIIKIRAATILIPIIGLLYFCSRQASGRPETSKISVMDKIDGDFIVNQSQMEYNEINDRCSSAEEELDRCSAQLIAIGRGGNPYPNNLYELNSKYCPKFKKTVECIKNASDCYKPFERQVIGWILTSTRRMNYKRCRNEAEKSRFLSLTNSCFASIQEPMNSCMADYVSRLEAIAEEDVSEEDDIQIQLSCCANQRFKECVMDNGRQQCRSVDGLKKLMRTNSVSSNRIAQKLVFKAKEEMMEDLRKTLEGMSLTGPNLVCSKVDDKFCRKHFDGKYNDGRAKHKSIVPALLKIYTKN